MISVDWARSLLCGGDEAGKWARLVSGGSGGVTGERSARAEARGELGWCAQERKSWAAVLGPGDVSALGRCGAEGEKGKTGWAGRGEKLGRAFGPRVGLRFSFSISISNKV